MKIKNAKFVDIYNTDKKYNIIYADPPWRYNDRASSGKRGAEYKYNVMDIDNIKQLPIQNISADDCVLFIWVTMPMLNVVFDVIKEWGFKYKTCGFNWIKTNKKSESLFWGMGNWTRANSELCLLATKGKPKRQSAKVHSVVMSKIREHSRKPDEIRNKIVELCGDLPRIELFARQEAKDRDCWGDEV